MKPSVTQHSFPQNFQKFSHKKFGNQKILRHICINNFVKPYY